MESRKLRCYVVVVLLVVGYMWLFMLDKTLHPAFCTKLRVKEEILSMEEEENENRVVHLVKTQNSLICMDYEKINSFLYRNGTKHKRTVWKDIVIDYFIAGQDEECFIWGYCKDATFKTIIFTFPDDTELVAVPNEEGLFLQQSLYEPLDAVRIVGYTDTEEAIELLEYIVDVY